MRKLFKFIFFKLFPWRGRKQLESPADFFFDSQPNILRAVFKKLTIYKFSETFLPEIFLWKWESSSDEDAEIFLIKSRKLFAQGPKKIRRLTFQKKLSHTFFFGLATFVFDNPAETFPTIFRKNSVYCPKIVKNCMFWKTIFFSKVFLRTRKMQI